MKKDRNYKGSKRDMTRNRTKKRACYNCGEYGHFIAECPHEKKENKDSKKNKEKSQGKNKKMFKKRYSGQAHIGQEWDSNDESEDSDDEGAANIAIKNSSSSNSLFPNIKKKGAHHTCLMAKESKRKVKSKSSPSSKYVDSDEEYASVCDTNDDEKEVSDDEAWLKGLSKKAMSKIGELMEQLEAKDKLLEKQEKLLVREMKKSNELEKLLELQMKESEEVDNELAKSKETIKSLKNSNVALQDSHKALQKAHQELEVQFETLWSSTSSSPSTKASTSNGCERCYKIVDINAHLANDKTIDHLKKKVSTLEAQVQEKKKPSIDEKIEYARSAYKNARRSHIKSGIGYERGARQNARESKNGLQLIKFTKEGSYQKKQEKIKTTNTSSHAHHFSANASFSNHKLFHEFDASYVLMKNAYGKIIAKYVGPRNTKPKTCVWVPKSLVTNVRGPNQIWVPKNKN